MNFAPCESESRSWRLGREPQTLVIWPSKLEDFSKIGVEEMTYGHQFLIASVCGSLPSRQERLSDSQEGERTRVAFEHIGKHVNHLTSMLQLEFQCEAKCDHGTAVVVWTKVRCRGDVCLRFALAWTGSSQISNPPVRMVNICPEIWGLFIRFLLVIEEIPVFSLMSRYLSERQIIISNDYFSIFRELPLNNSKWQSFIHYHNLVAMSSPKINSIVCQKNILVLLKGSHDQIEILMPIYQAGAWHQWLHLFVRDSESSMPSE
jgi:hypothetical protein